MTDWRENGEVVRSYFLRELSLAGAAIRPAVQEFSGSFVAVAVRAFGREQNREPLIAWLRSDKPMAEFERECLAECLEMPPPAGKGPGRRKNRDVHDASHSATMVFKRWRRLNKEMGINDYGHRSEMLDVSIRIGLEIDGLDGVVDPVDVRALLDRPASRRK